jgi:hypothetical protein
MIGYEIRQIQDVVICLIFYGQTLTDAVRNLSLKIIALNYGKSRDRNITRFIAVFLKINLLKPQ